MRMSARLLADKLGDLVFDCDIPGSIEPFFSLEFARPAARFLPGRAYVADRVDQAPPGCVLISTDQAPAVEGSAVIRCHGSLDEIYARAMDAFDRHSQFETRLRTSLEQNQDLGEIIEMAAEYLGNQLLVIDRSLGVVAMSHLAVKEKDDTWDFLSRHNRIPEDVLKKMEPLYSASKKSEAQYSARLDKGTELYHIPNVHADLVDGSVYLGWLILVANHQAMTAGMLDLLDMLTAPISHLLRIRHDEQKPNLKFQEYYWREFLQGRLESREIVQSLRDSRNWAETDFFRVSCLDPGIARTAGPQPSRLIRSIKAMVAGCPVLETEDGLMVVERLPAGTKQTSPLLNAGCSVGVSDICIGFSRLPQLLTQARLALDHARRDKQPAIIFFSNIAIECLLGKSLPASSWPAFIHPLIWQLQIDNPAQFEKSAGTLKVYLENERHLTLAAQKLFVHKNTLLYRIRNLEASLGLEMDQPAERLRLLLSLNLLDIQREAEL